MNYILDHFTLFIYFILFLFYFILFVFKIKKDPNSQVSGTYEAPDGTVGVTEDLLQPNKR